MEVFDVYSTDDLQGFLKAKIAEGWEVVGTVSRPEDVEDVPVISCSEFRWDKPLIVVIGSEGEGLSLETQLQCQRMLAIPPGRALHPGIDSLNVSVAAGESTNPQLLHLTVQHPGPLNDFIVVWEKKIPYYLFIYFCFPTGIILHSICSQKRRHGD
uniref:tRNA/rRNA methyltransferase SpoU type domain-containing protein n=1 Tax=Catharus ustulatus TaxID=91951 RepID=A0A8C3Y2T5_CATUS